MLPTTPVMLTFLPTCHIDIYLSGREEDEHLNVTCGQYASKLAELATQAGSFLRLSRFRKEVTTSHTTVQ